MLDLSENRLAKLEHLAATLAQFICPFVAQIAQTLVHLLGLSLYNSPLASPRERARAVGEQFAKAYAARASRTAVVYSAGGTLNRVLQSTVSGGAAA